MTTAGGTFVPPLMMRGLTPLPLGRIRGDWELQNRPTTIYLQTCCLSPTFRFSPSHNETAFLHGYINEVSVDVKLLTMVQQRKHVIESKSIDSWAVGEATNLHKVNRSRDYGYCFCWALQE